MKRKMGAIVFGVAAIFVCSGFGIAQDGELLAFEKVHQNPQEAVRINGKNIVLPEVSQLTANEGVSGATVRRQPHMVVMKDLLKDLSSEDRSELLNSMMLKNGRVVSMSIAPLRRNFNSEKVDTIVRAIHYHLEGEDRDVQVNAGRTARYTEISKLLKDLSRSVRNEFLDSLMFKDGYFVSAYIGGLRKAVSPSRMDEIIKAVATTPGPVVAFGPKAFCPGAICYDAVCYGPSEGDPYCKDGRDSTCDTTCHSYD